MALNTRMGQNAKEADADLFRNYMNFKLHFFFFDICFINIIKKYNKKPIDIYSLIIYNIIKDRG